MTDTTPRRAHVTGWGRYAPAQVLTNADLERMVDTSDEWIVSTDRHPRAAGRRRPRDDRVDGRRRIAAGDPDGRHRARRHRPHPARHADPRLLDAVDRRPRQGGDRQHEGRGHGRGRCVLGVRVRVRDGAGVHRRRAGPARARHRGGAADAVPRLHRPEHLHPVRRRRRCCRPVGERRARWGVGHRADDRAAGRLHDLAAGRWREEPAVGRDDRTRRALHPHGGQGDLPVRDEDDGDDGPRVGQEVGSRRRQTSTCSSRTRPTSASSRRWPRASTCPWTRCT